MHWLRPILILGALVALIAINVIEFRNKRRAEKPLLDLLEAGSPSQRLQAQQYRQTQNIEQLLHVISSTLIAVLIALLWS